jgi:tRNA (mo5U34)-methyltransferase
LTEQEIREGVKRLAPFHHRVELPYNISTHVPKAALRPALERTRVERLVNYAFPPLLDEFGGSLAGKRVLDIACNCGGFSVEAARLGSAYVLGIDIVDHYIEQANFIKRALDLSTVRFETMDIRSLDKDAVGTFDVTFCFGILYHLEDPVASMRKIAAVTSDVLLVDTDLMPPPRWNKKVFKKPLWRMNVAPAAGDDSNVRTTSLWRAEEAVAQFTPNEAAVVELLRFLGFRRVEKLTSRIKGMKRYEQGRRATFLARRA